MTRAPRTLFMLAIGLLMLGAAVGAPASELTEDERLQFANGLYARDMHELAIREYAIFITAFPDSPHADVARFRLANSHLRMGETDRALNMFAAVFRDFPKSAYRTRAGFTLADLQRRTHRHKEAVKTLQDLLELDLPDDMASASWYALGSSLLDMGQWEPALKTFERVRHTYADSAVFPLALLQLGNLYAEGPLEDIAKAESLYTALAEKPPSDRLAAEALFQQAGMYFRRQTYDKAARIYTALLDRYPTDKRALEARIYAAWSAHRAGLFADALKLAETESGADRLEQELAAEWLYLKANSERQLLKHAEAVATYKTLLEHFPENPFAEPARFEQAVVLYRMGRFQEAATQARTVKISPEIAKDVYWLLAESYAALNQAGEAVQYYRLIVEQFPKSDVAADAAYRLARHLQAGNNHKEAARYYGMVAEAWPKHRLAPTALFAAAACRAQANLRAEAVRDWAMLIKNYPDDPLAERALYQKAMNEIRLKRDNEALFTLDELLKKHPKTQYLADAYYWRGLLLKEADKPGDAERMLRLALESEPRDDMKREAAFHLAALLLGMEKRQGEAADLIQSLIGTPGEAKLSPAHLQWLAEFRFETKAFDQSLAAALALTAAAPPGAARQAGWTLAGRAHETKNDLKAAQDSFIKALRENARTAYRAEAALRLGEIALNDGRHDEAIDHFTLAAEAAADDDAGRAIRARSYAGLGRAAQAAGRAEDATRFFMSVAILYDDPDIVPDCLQRAADLFDTLGQTDRATRARQELKERFPEYRPTNQDG